ncbi:MAG: SDR family oxidoreductase [Candidatus Eremiobacterota bacterium]
MNLELEGKTAIITNWDNRLGRAIAMEMAYEGLNLALCSRHNSSSHMFLKDMVNYDRFILNQTNKCQVEHTLNVIAEKFGSIDIVINNIDTIEFFGPFYHMDSDEGLNMLKDYLSSICHFIKGSIQFLKQSDNPRIINISSLSGKEPGINLAFYNMYSTAVMNLTKTLSKELAPYKILVNCICTGAVEGEMWDKFSDMLSDKTGMKTEDIVNIYSTNSIPLGRFATPEEISPLVVFLSSKKAAYITGTNIFIDGGASYSIC